MKRKKNPKYDYRSRRFPFFLFGLCLALLMVLGAFKYTEYRPLEPLWDTEIAYEAPIQIIQTVHEKQKQKKVAPDLSKKIIAARLPIVDPDPQPKPDPKPDPNPIKPITDPGAVFYVEPKVEPTDDPIFDWVKVSKQAEFKGNFLKYLKENVNYPIQAQDEEVEGVVLVSFIVERDGSISNVSFENKELGFGLEEAAMKVIKQTQSMWSPAEQRDKKVRVRMMVPVRFRLY